MTGHGAGEAPLGAGTVKMELRSVNHRHLDVRVRLSDELNEGAALVEDLLRNACVRGRVEATVRSEAPDQHGALDMARARSVYRSLLALRDELAPAMQVPVEAVLRAPHMFGSSGGLSSDELRDALKLATERAIADLHAMRAREGEALAKDMRERLDILRDHAIWISGRRPQVVENHRERLMQRLDKLLLGSDVQPDPARLAQEVALFADRSDVAEELTRLSSHIEQFCLLLKQDEAVGRKLDFLVQELGREVNTIGSKANDAPIAHRVVDMKAELERVREQVQNVL
jgi:uncharacterized protein (TIGR00255 family)